MALWAVAWSGLMPIANVELVEAETAEEALEEVHRKVTMRYTSIPEELQIERPVPREVEEL